MNSKTITSQYLADQGPEEPMLCMLRGYDDCETCYYRLSTISRLTQGVKKLHREA